MMSKETNKQVIQKFVEFINTANKDLAKELISEDVTFYAPTKSEPLKGLNGYFAILDMMRQGFPDIQWQLEEMIEEEESIAVRFTMTGTHKGSFLNIEPTYKKIRVGVMNFYTFSNGKIIKEYGQPDIFGLLQQLGVVKL